MQTKSRDDRETIAAIIADIVPALEGMRRAASRRLLECGASRMQLHLLMLLSEHGSLPMSRLAEAMDISVSNATGLVDRMEERGLVERVRDPQDRRIVKVANTRAGSEMLATMDVMRIDAITRVLERLSHAQLDRLRLAIVDLKAAHAAELTGRHERAAGTEGTALG